MHTRERKASPHFTLGFRTKLAKVSCMPPFPCLCQRFFSFYTLLKLPRFRFWKPFSPAVGADARTGCGDTGNVTWAGIYVLSPPLAGILPVDLVRQQQKARYLAVASICTYQTEGLPTPLQKGRPHFKTSNHLAARLSSPVVLQNAAKTSHATKRGLIAELFSGKPVVTAGGLTAIGPYRVVFSGTPQAARA